MKESIKVYKTSITTQDLAGYIYNKSVKEKIENPKEFLLNKCNFETSYDMYEDIINMKHSNIEKVETLFLENLEEFDNFVNKYDLFTINKDHNEFILIDVLYNEDYLLSQYK